jgi:hypothetical protein
VRPEPASMKDMCAPQPGSSYIGASVACHHCIRGVFDFRKQGLMQAIGVDRLAGQRFP